MTGASPAAPGAAQLCTARAGADRGDTSLARHTLSTIDKIYGDAQWPMTD